MEQERIRLLQQMPIFGGIRDETLAFLLALTPVVHVPHDEFFFREGDAADSMFVLEAGSVAVLKNWRGEQHLLHHLGRGDCFGEIALMDLMPRSASVRAVADCSAIQLSAANLFQVYEKDLEQFTMIQMNMGREVCRRLRQADERLFRARMGAPEGGAEGVFRAA